jgi:tetratricopeptide (TPR) repeat protein
MIPPLIFAPSGSENIAEKVVMLCSRTFSLVTILFIFLALTSAAGQGTRSRSLPVTVHGQVRYAHGGTPAYNVLVRLEKFSGGLEGEVQTDRNGKFQFSGMPPAQYIIKIRYPGFKDEVRQIDLQTTASEYVLFQLVPEQDEAVKKVVGIKLLDANVPIIAQKEFEKAQIAFLGDKKGRIDEAVQHLEKAIAIYPRFYEALNTLGAIYISQQNWIKAEEALILAREIHPNSAETPFLLGELNLAQTHYAEAEKFLREGLRIDNRSWKGHFMLGRLYWRQGELVKAGKQIALTLQLNPNLAEAHLLGANILLRAGNREDALAEFNEYLRLAPHGEYSAQVRETAQKIKTSLNEKK